MIPNAVAVLNGKGGVGKTTTTAHLAGVAAAQGWRTLAVDLDPQGNLFRSLGYAFDNGEALAAALVGGSSVEPTRGVRPGLDVIGGGDAIEDAVMRMRVEAMNGAPVNYRLREVLAPLATDYDLVVIDSPPREMFGRRLILTAAHFVVAPVDLDEAAYDGLASVMRSIGEARTTGNPDLELLGVIRFRIATKQMAKDIASEVSALLGDGLLVEPWIRNAQRVADELRKDGLLAHEYEQAAASAKPWYEARKDGSKTYSKAGSGLAGDWWDAVSEILRRYADKTAVRQEVPA